MAKRQLSMTPDAIYQREKRARQKAERRAALEQGTPIIAPEIEVAAAAPEAPKTLKDRLFGFVKAEPTAAAKKTSARSGKGDNLLVTLLPTVASSFIATYSRNLLPAEYADCAPQQAEVAGMLTPIMAIIGRRVEVVGKASQDAIDAANALVMLLAYGARASVVYMDIKRSKKEEADDKEAEASGDDRGAIRADQGPRAGTIRPGLNRAEAGGHPDSAARISEQHHTDDDHDAPENAGGEVNLMAGMFERDRQGRVRLGLLPGGVSRNGYSADSAPGRQP